MIFRIILLCDIHPLGNFESIKLLILKSEDIFNWEDLFNYMLSKNGFNHMYTFCIILLKDTRKIKMINCGVMGWDYE